MELIEKAIKYLTDLGVTRGLAIAYLIVSALLAVMIIAALVMRIILVVKYSKANHATTKNGKTSFEVAEEALKAAGLNDVKIKKASWLRAFFIGNCYSVRRKTIYLRGRIANKDSITAVSVALQKVALAKMDHDGDKTVRVRNASQVLSLVGPILFIPIILLGAIIDLVLFSQFGLVSIICLGVSTFIILAGFVELLLNLPVETKANKMALKIITDSKVLDEEEIETTKKVFEAYKLTYICEFIVAVIRIVQIILEIVMKIQISNNRK